HQVMERHSIDLPDIPRCMQSLFCRILDHANLRRVTQASNCKYCNVNKIHSDIRELEEEIYHNTSINGRALLQVELSALQKRKKKAELHRIRESVQRDYIKQLLKNLRRNEIVVWMDFASWREPNSSKCNDLIIVLQTRSVAGELETRYIDIT